MQILYLYVGPDRFMNSTVYARTLNITMIQVFLHEPTAKQTNKIKQCQKNKIYKKMY